MTSCDSADCTTRTACPCGLAPARPLNITVTVTTETVTATNHDTGEIREFDLAAYRRPFDKLARHLDEWTDR